VSSLSQQRLGGWRQNEKTRKVLKRPGFGVSNSYGFIGPEFSIRKTKDTYRIVALGSSTTAGNLGIAGTLRYPYTGFLQELFDGKGEFKTFRRNQIRRYLVQASRRRHTPQIAPTMNKAKTACVTSIDKRRR